MKPHIYTVATAHLDTSWNWDFETTLREFLPRTVYDNLPLFAKYPEYVFSFEGSYRYELLEEYDPAAFEQVKQLIAQGRWRVAGSSYENGDVNIPSPEALFRNILYGNDYFDQTFGKRSKDIYLPDCFGFGWALPSVAAHANLLGFTTQKLCWSSAYGIPFDLGVWRGPDGEQIYASLDGRNYAACLKRIRRHSAHLKLNGNLRKYGLPFTHLLHGIGDRGGAPKEESVETVMRELRLNGKQAVEVLCAGSDDVFRDMAELPPEMQTRLPVWEKELVMTDHGVGCYTSRAVGKRWNRRGEQLAEAAERASIAALLLGQRSYPKAALDTCWKRIIAHQFHDDITGTSLVRCYKRNWNDYILSLNQLSEEYRFSAACAAQGLDWSFVQGTPLLLSNPLQFARTEAVCANIPVSPGCTALRVFSGDGAEIPAQVEHITEGIAQLAFLAEVPAFGFAAFDVREAECPCELQTELRVTEHTLENDNYQIHLDANGDISGIYDKKAYRELLQKPIRMAIHAYEGFANYPAWELEYNEVMAPPRKYAANPVIEVLAQGPARILLRITRSAGESRFVQTLSLDAGGKILRVENEIEWRSLCSLLKTEFPFTTANSEATYDLGLGTIRRGNNHKRLYEVPAQMWADLSERSGCWGVSILSDSRVGWDKPDDHTLRLTGMHTPRSTYREGQHLLDTGLNRYGFGIFAHTGPCLGTTQEAALCFNQPIAVFILPETPRDGGFGSAFSFAQCAGEGVLVRAIKQAQHGDEIVLRVNEGIGETCKEAAFTIGGGITGARELYASEEEKAGTVFRVEDGVLHFAMTPSQVRTFALTVEPLPLPQQYQVSAFTLPLNCRVCTTNENRGAVSLPNGLSIPAELLPETVHSAGIPFHTGANGLDFDALSCQGQTLPLPRGAQRLHLLAAACKGDTQTSLLLDGRQIPFTVQDMQEAIGTWDLYSEGETGYIKTDALGWNATHAHSAQGEQFAKHLYFFHYSFDLDDAEACVLPDNADIILLGATLTRGEPCAQIAYPLFDRLEKRPCTFQITPEQEAYALERGKKERKGKAKFLKNYIVRRLAAEAGRFQRDES